MSKEVSRLNLNDISFSTNNFQKQPKYFEAAKERFIDMQNRKIPKRSSVDGGGDAMTIEIAAKTDDMSENFSRP